MTSRTGRALGAILIGTATLLTASASPVTAAPPRAGDVPARAEVDRNLWDDRITESSGLARSTFERPLLWTHNDSGDSERVFAVGRDGNTRAVLTLDGTNHIDWEDISSGPGHSLWVADVGDNGWDRDHVTVYRFTEPRAVESREVDAVSYDFKYEDGPRDAEAIMVRPRTGRLFVISKVEDGGAIYRAPRDLSSTSMNTLKRVASAPGVVTGASFAPDGDSFVLVTYTRFYVYSSIKGSATSQGSKVNDSAQGESVEIGRGGKRLFLGEEGDNSPVYEERYNAP